MRIRWSLGIIPLLVSLALRRVFPRRRDRHPHSHGDTGVAR